MIERDVQYFDTPFRHAVIDNFFNDKDYKSLTEILNHNEKTIEFIKGSIIDLSKDPDQVHNWVTTPDEIMAPYFKYISSLETLKLDHEKEFSSEYRYYVRSKNSDFDPYPIHTENLYKAMSLVVYMGEHHNYGTELYDNDREFVKEIEWKDNRAFIMCGYSNQKGKLSGNSTWHAYRIKPETIRRTIFGYVCATENSCKHHSLADLYGKTPKKYISQGPEGSLVIKKDSTTEGILFGDKFPGPRK